MQVPIGVERSSVHVAQGLQFPGSGDEAGKV